MEHYDCIEVNYIREANVVNIITRKNLKLLNEKNLPIAKESTTIPVCSKRIYRIRRIHLTFICNDNYSKKGNVIIIIMLLYFYFLYIYHITKYFFKKYRLFIQQ